MHKERPILFSGAMVRAILEGKKTQTRRVVKPQPDEMSARNYYLGDWVAKSPYGRKGDRLWVRETWYCDHCFERDYDRTARWYEGKLLPPEECEKEWLGENREHMYYRADVPSGRFCDAGYWGEPGSHWKPSIHMPRWASRITLEVTGVRVERLQEISREDAWEEGIPQTAGEAGPLGLMNPEEPGHEWDNRTSVENFARLWESINGPGSWAANPWVWVVEFKRVPESSKPETEGEHG